MSAPKTLAPRYAYRGSKLPITITGDALKDVVSCDLGPDIPCSSPPKVILPGVEIEFEIEISKDAAQGVRKVWLIDSAGNPQDAKNFPLTFEVK